MTVKPMVGVVTVTYNSADVIDDFMESMLAQSFDNFVLYVIDNASSDATLEKVARYADPRIVVIANASNIGVAAGNNQGIRESLRAGCSHVLLINNDTVFGPELVQDLFEGLTRHDCDIIVPKMMYFDRKDVIWFAGGYFNKWKIYANVHVGENEVDTGAYDVARRIDYAPTCCMLMEASVFARIGIMDEKYFVYYDDTDFCLRSYFQSVKLFYYPDCVLYHKVNSLTGGTVSDFSLRYGHRNRIYYVRKHVPYFSAIAVCYCLGRVAAKTLSGSYRLRQARIAVKGVWEGISMALNPGSDNDFRPDADS